MNTAELPMILFTVIAQMCVGMFLVLGVIDLWLSRSHPRAQVERITEPVVYAIGPALVLALVISMFHMNDVTHVFNVLRHVGSSWLSREIWFGVGFAALGFAYAIMQWMRWGSALVRRIVAGLAAVVGLGLVWSMSMIYYSLVTVPAWHTRVVPVHFFSTAVLLGSLAVAAALMATALIRRRALAGLDAGHEGAGTPAKGKATLMDRVRARATEVNAPTTDTEWTLTTDVVRRATLAGLVAGVVVLVTYPVHIAHLAGGNATAQASAHAFSGAFFVVRLVLLALAAVLIAVVSYQVAGTAKREQPNLLAVWVCAAFIIAVAAELSGRALHYESMFRVGI
ncbi:MAG: dimethyl sulfoxide reductase anchor subunit [Micrococcales bacterium]|nr:dimethyl sulfoxide reductase anchor subunit [Micrococcales bacterium]MCL2666403.1 dimethyl sulfoxide reductase anchor subunit [Micrococcales bacterium]